MIAVGRRPAPCVAPLMAGAIRTAMTKVFVTGLKVQAEIGVYKHEIGRVQPLVVDVELDVPHRRRRASRRDAQLRDHPGSGVWRSPAAGHHRTGRDLRRAPGARPALAEQAGVTPGPGCGWKKPLALAPDAGRRPASRSPSSATEILRKPYLARARRLRHDRGVFKEMTPMDL